MIITKGGANQCEEAVKCNERPLDCRLRIQEFSLSLKFAMKSWTNH